MAHGVNVQEQSVGARPAVQVDSALPVYVGTAPIHKTAKRGNANKPILALAGEDFFVSLTKGGTLDEPFEAHFTTYGVAPVIFINVLDPANPAHVASVVNEAHAVVDADLPIALTHKEALAVSQVERSTAGENEVANLAYTPGSVGNGTLGAVLVAAADPTDVGAYSITCTAAATPELYAIAGMGYVGTGNGNMAAILADVDPSDAGAYTLTCTKAVAGLDPSEWQLAKAGVPVGAVILADGTQQTRGGIAFVIEEGAVLYIVGDAYAFTITYAAAAPSAFSVVTPQTPAGIAVNADGGPHVADGVRVTIAEGAVAFQVGDDWTFDVQLNAVAWSVVPPGDYSLVYAADDHDSAQLQPRAGGVIVDGDSIRIDYTWLNPALVTQSDIIGGYAGGLYTGCEVIHQVYPRLKRVPTLLLAPQWSHVPAVASKLRAVGDSVSGELRAFAWTDLSSDIADIANYSLAPTWKTAQGFTAEDAGVCWPAVKDLDGAVGRMSVHMACLCGQTDHAYGDLPYASPSNKAMQISGVILTNAGVEASELYLDKPQANSLNGQGIVTARQSPALGWVSWGNRTGIYPSDTDPRVAFIAVRRMMNHLHNTLVLTAERDVDAPGNRRLIDGVVQTMQALLNGYVAAGALVGSPTISFLESKNPVVDMADGKFVFTFDKVCPPSPAEEITFDVNYDSSAMADLFN